MRLYLYLQATGQEPTLQAANYFELSAKLRKQYLELGPEVRRRGRTLGRKLIRADGLIAAYERSEILLPFNPQITSRPKCSVCRVKKLNKPKAIWGTKEEAEEFCGCFPSFTPYPCPVGNGWHVTRRRRCKMQVSLGHQSLMSRITACRSIPTERAAMDSISYCKVRRY
jgi:hypothetical protein